MKALLYPGACAAAIAAEKWRKDGGRTVVTLALAQHESVFVVLPAKAGDSSCARNSSISRTSSSSSIATLTSPWSVSFQSDALHRGPAEPLVLDSLFNLSTSTNSVIKFYSGRITYKAKFARKGHACCDRAITDASGASLPNRTILDLGDVAVTAKVKVNGKYAGGVCFAPYRLDITPFVKEGENDLEIEVCNLWANRLVGDDGDPNRPTWTIRACCNAKTPLPKSGLLGPVRIFTER